MLPASFCAWVEARTVVLKLAVVGVFFVFLVKTLRMLYFEPRWMVEF